MEILHAEPLIMLYNEADDFIALSCASKAHCL